MQYYRRWATNQGSRHRNMSSLSLYQSRRIDQSLELIAKEGRNWWCLVHYLHTYKYQWISNMFFYTERGTNPCTGGHSQISLEVQAALRLCSGPRTRRCLCNYCSSLLLRSPESRNHFYNWDRSMWFRIQSLKYFYLSQDQCTYNPKNIYLLYILRQHK